MAKRKQRPARLPHLQAEPLLRSRLGGNVSSSARQAEERPWQGEGGDIKSSLARFEGRSPLDLTFEGKGNEVIDEPPLLGIQGMRSHLGLPSLGEDRVRAWCGFLILGPGGRYTVLECALIRGQGG